MSLSSALRIAQSSIFNTSYQTSVTSRNISEASNPDYVRRNADLVSTEGGARVAEIRRNEDVALFRSSLNALSSSAGQSVIFEAATRLNYMVNSSDNSTAPATLLSQFENALQLYSSDPSNSLAGENAIYAAKELANGISDASSAVQSYRGAVDLEIADGVARVNELLDEFGALNDEVVQGTALGKDVNDAMDARDLVLKELSGYISISTVGRRDNDLMIFTAQGVTLFETVPRTVSFDPISAHAPGVPGNQIFIDGVPLNAGSGANTDAIGSLSAMLQARDDLAMDVQGQLDEIARGLVVAFAETDQTASALPDQAGLFTYAGGPAVPTGATAVNGLALSLSVNGLFDPDLGGDPQLLRDGGANGAAYVANAAGSAAFADNLIRYTEQIDEPISTDPAFGLTGNYTLSNYAESSIGYLDSIRQAASRASESDAALSERLSSMLSATTGVNLDEELSMLIELEQSYQASARIIATVDEMFAALFGAFR